MPGPSPFIIRGHHLGTYAELASWRADPRTLAREMISGMVRRTESDSEEKRAYAQDVIGRGSEGAALVASRYRAIFERFEDLGQDESVTITTGSRDHICNGCVVGNHCADRGAEMAVDTEYGRLQVFERDLLDMDAIRAFKKLAGRLAKDGRIEPSLGSYDIAPIPEPTPDAAPMTGPDLERVEPPIQANAGYVKGVLAHWNIAQTLRY